MSWRFVSCPYCGTTQEKVGDAEEAMFCTECCNEWVEDKKKKKGKKKHKKKH